jgi:putative tryptophan/tyrosine transport system substrate-binding protein
VRRRHALVLLGGAAAALPLPARAQGKTMPVIGYLSTNIPPASFLSAFRQGLGEAGFIEQQNVVIEYRSAEGRYDLLPALAADLVARKVDIIVAGGAPAATAAKAATSTIPIVFTGGMDPVETGLVASLGRPGGNITGVTYLFAEMQPKRLELVCELVPQAKIIALLVNPDYAGTAPTIQSMQKAAGGKAVQLPIIRATSESEIDGAFGTLGQLQVAALIVGSDPFFFGRHEQLVRLASRQAIPAIYFTREFAEDGGLISYGASIPAASSQIGAYAGKILNGAKPADLPVQQPTTFELVINLKTAKTLGLTVPQSLLLRADEVIE